jgi:hypothetical protein
MLFHSLASVASIDYLCSRHQSKGKAPARLESPVISSSDESGSGQISDTPKGKGRPSVIISKALESVSWFIYYGY